MTAQDRDTTMKTDWRNPASQCGMRVLPGAALLLACACSPLYSEFPMPISEAALGVFVESSETGEPISNARIVATDGSYVTHLLEMQGMPGSYMGVYRSGVYRIDLIADGYVSKSLKDVEVVWGREAQDPWYDPVGIVVSLDPE